MLSLVRYQAPESYRKRENSKTAEARLRGTIWHHVEAAHTLYRACMALGRWLGGLGFSANAFTYASLIMAALAGVAAGLGHYILAAAIILLSGACDLLDGVIARSTNTVSSYGALLDSTVDRLADGLPLLGLVVVYAEYGWLAVIPALAMLGGLIVSYIRARAEALGAVLPPLFMRRAERLVLLVISLLLGALPVASPVPAPLLLVGLSVLSVLNIAGALGAMRAAHAVLGAPKSIAVEPHGPEAKRRSRSPGSVSPGSVGPRSSSPRSSSPRSSSPRSSRPRDAEATAR